MCDFAIFLAVITSLNLRRENVRGKWWTQSILAEGRDIFLTTHDVKLEVLPEPGITFTYDFELTLKAMVNTDLKSFDMITKMWDQTFTTGVTMDLDRGDKLALMMNLSPGYSTYPNKLSLGAATLSETREPVFSSLAIEKTIRMDWPNGDSLATELKINPVTGNP